MPTVSGLNSNGLNFSGLATGIDSAKIIDGLTAINQRRIDTFTTRKADSPVAAVRRLHPSGPTRRFAVEIRRPVAFRRRRLRRPPGHGLGRQSDSCHRRYGRHPGPVHRHRRLAVAVSSDSVGRLRGRELRDQDRYAVPAGRHRGDQNGHDRRPERDRAGPRGRDQRRRGRRPRHDHSRRLGDAVPTAPDRDEARRGERHRGDEQFDGGLRRGHRPGRDDRSGRDRRERHARHRARGRHGPLHLEHAHEPDPRRIPESAQGGPRHAAVDDGRDRFRQRDEVRSGVRRRV